MSKHSLLAALASAVLTASLVLAGPAAAREVGARLGISAATSTTTVPMQIRLTSSSGTPINGLKTMTFKLYSVGSGGVALWSEIWTGGNAVQVTDGLASVLLGSQTALPLNLVANASTLYLGITVDVEAEMQPRVQLGSAPIAMTVPDGAIVAAKIANGAVTGQKLSLQQGRSCLSLENGQNPSYAMNGTPSRAVIPELTLQFTLPVQSRVMVLIDGLMKFSQNAESGVVLLVDGTDTTGSLTYGSGVWTNLKGSRVITLDPGPHTLTVEAYSYNLVGGVTLAAGGAYITCVWYTELGD